MEFISKIRLRLTPGLVLISAYFLFLTVGLFLGDGKEPLVDLFAGLAVIFLSLFAGKYLKKERNLPPFFFYCWLGIIGYCIVRTIFSDSVAYSVISTMRFIIGYLIFSLFYEYTDKQTSMLFIKGLLLLSTLAMLSSLVFIMSPGATSILPQTNLLYAYYGHNHLAIILIAVFPIVLSLVFHPKFRIPASSELPLRLDRIEASQRDEQNLKSKILTTCYLLLYTLSLLLTFSRGAFALIGISLIIYAMMIIRGSSHGNPRHRGKVFFYILVAMFLLFSIILLPFVAHRYSPEIFSGWLNHQINKPPLWEDGRIFYLQQSLEAIRVYPLFGTGPGTFGITSRQFERSPLEYSWYAHNSILEWLVELGIVGTVPILLLLITICKRVIQLTRSTYNSSSYSVLWAMALLLFATSLYDFSFDFLIIWLIFWSLLGIITARTQEFNRTS